jgi:predicted MPP superfamily phosphohydrolase
LENNQDNIFTISLIHQPDMVTDILSQYSVDLALAGHSLGGQINIPGIGGLFKIDGANKYINDYYQINNTDLYVSSGLGTRKYPYRFLNHPSISLFRLK